jgi:hypothetical protein
MMKALVVLVVLGGIAAADVHTNKAAKVSVDIPKTYKLTETDDVIRGESADKAVAVFYWNVDTGDAAEATKKLGQELYAAVGSLSWNKPTSGKLNGLDVQWITGTGRSVGNTLDISVVLAGPTATKRHVMVVGIVDHAKADAHKAEIAAILKSLKPAK